jgi:hypothetical protein
VFLGVVKDLREMKSISDYRQGTTVELNAIHVSRCRPTVGILRRVPSEFLGLFRSLFDMPQISLYSTKTCGAAVSKFRPAGNGFNGLFVHSRDVYVLLSEQHRAGVFPGLDSENIASDRQRPTAPAGAVGLCFWG